MFEEAGFPAIATSSAALFGALGFRDGEEIGRARLAEAVGRIVRSVSLPVSADIVAGFGATPAALRATVRAMLRVGAIGVNLEDVAPPSRRLVPFPRQLRQVEELVRLRDAGPVRFVVNARTDALRRAPGNARERFREAVRRAAAFRDAGADCVYPMGLSAREEIGEFVRALDCPVNVMVRPGLPSLSELRRLGVARVSFGPSGMYATLGFLGRVAREIRTSGSFAGLTDGALRYEELERLSGPAAPGGAAASLRARPKLK